MKIYQVLILGIMLLAFGCKQSEQQAQLDTAVPAHTITAATIDQVVLLAQLGDGILTKIALSPVDGRIFVGTTIGVYVYDGDTAVSHDFFPADGPVDDITISPDGQIMAIITRPDYAVQFWQIAGHRLLHAPSASRSVHFTADGRRALLGRDDDLQIIDTRSGTELARFTPPSGGQLRTPFFSPDDALIAVANRQDQTGSMQLWESSGRQPARILQAEENMLLTKGAFSDDGLLLGAVGWDPLSDKSEQLVIWELADRGKGQTLQAPVGIFGNAWAIAPDSSVIAASLMNGQVALWSRGAVEPSHLLELKPTSLATAVSFTADGERLIVGRVNGRVEIWQLSDGILLHEVALPTNTIMQILLRPDAPGFVVATEDGQIVTLDEAGRPIGQAITRHAYGAIESVAFVPNSPLLAVGSRHGRVTFWDTAVQEATANLPRHNGAVQSLAFNPAADLLAVGTAQSLNPQQYDDTIRVWQWAAGGLAQQFGGERENVAGCSSFRSSVVYSPDGRFLVNGSHNFTAEVRDAATGDLLHSLDAHRGAVYGAAFSPDSRFLATASEDGFVRVWRTDSFGLVAEMINGVDGVTAIAFSPNGRFLVSGSLLGTIDVWDTTNWELRYSVASEKNRFSRLAFSPDGSLLAAGVDQNAIQLWTTDTFTPIQRLEADSGVVEALAFSNDGALLAVGSSDGVVQIWGINQKN